MSVRPIFSPKMTSENATRDRSQGTFWRKSAKSNPKGQFFFFFFFFFLSRQSNAGNANEKQISNSNFSFFFEQVVNIPIVNGRSCTSCEEAYMGAFKTAWALGFVPQRGITYSIET